MIKVMKVGQFPIFQSERFDLNINTRFHETTSRITYCSEKNSYIFVEHLQNNYNVSLVLHVYVRSFVTDNCQPNHSSNNFFVRATRITYLNL